jgi:hypothetical protein
MFYVKFFDIASKFRICPILVIAIHIIFHLQININLISSGETDENDEKCE